jgi:hypothetical protein
MEKKIRDGHLESHSLFYLPFCKPNGLDCTVRSLCSNCHPRRYRITGKEDPHGGAHVYSIEGEGNDRGEESRVD